MTKVLSAAGRYARKRWKLERLEAFVYPHNQASILVLERSGFRRERLLEDFYKRDGQLVDALLFTKTC